MALACGPVGYLCGLALLVPLVDRYPPRFVVAAQFGCLAAALTLNAIAGQVWLLGLALGGTLATAATIALGLGLANPVTALICLALFDAGLFAAQVANQSTVLAIDPTAPARFNSAYMVVYFVGGSLGTAFGAWAVEWLGWPSMVAVATGAVVVAAAITFGAPTARSVRDQE